MELNLILTKYINDIPVDGYYGDREAWFTRQQIGQALEYADPQKAIDNIHARNKGRLDLFSVPLKLRGTDGKEYQTYVYNFKGVLEICRRSRQPKADMVMDALYDMAEQVIERGYYSTIPDSILVNSLIKRLVVRPNLLKEQRFSRHNDTYLKTFTRQERADILFNKRWELTQSDYFKQLDEICGEDVGLLNKEVTKYLRWKHARSRMAL